MRVARPPSLGAPGGVRVGRAALQERPEVPPLGLKLTCEPMESRAVRHMRGKKWAEAENMVD